MSEKVKKEIEEFERTLLEDRLRQCTEKQVAFFKKIYPNGVPESKLIDAIDLCNRTIRKNVENPERLKENLLLNQSDETEVEIA